MSVNKDINENVRLGGKKHGEQRLRKNLRWNEQWIL